MKRLLALLMTLGFCGCRTATNVTETRSESAGRLERIVVTADGRGFAKADSGKPFHPWGMNYGNAGRLMEDFWNADWETFARDFRELKALGANVIRVHLQFGKFMDAPDRPNPHALRQFQRMLKLAEKAGLYLDVTGLACYRPADTPAWYDALDEPARWTAQAQFWETIATVGASSGAIFCYDLMNEPISPAERRKAGQWRSGHLFGGFDFVQYIALDPAGRTREEIVRQWIDRMTAVIRKHDTNALVTVGLLPWSRQWKHLSGFMPEKIASQLDFISVHIYPDQSRPDEAMESLRVCAIGKPVVIEETFPLSCDPAQLEQFFRASREVACGWIGHYDGQTLEELDALEGSGQLKGSPVVYREWLRLFVRLKPEISP
jgi:hypothetical protein